MRPIRPILPLTLVLAACGPEFVISPIDLPNPIPIDPPTLGPVAEEEVLRQVIPEKVDVLWLIDDSQSMLLEQRGLSNNAEVFLQIYRESGLDWHIGVITTNMRDDSDSGRLQPAAGFRWVDPTVPDPVAVFQEMAVVGRDGPIFEKGRAAIYASLTDPDAVTFNKGFFRPDARLSIIIVSDEEDDSGNNPSYDAFLDFLLELKPEREMITVSAVTTLDEQCGQNDEVAWGYRDLVAATGGVEFDICEDDWTPVLRDLAKLGAGLRRTFYLPQLPIPDTLDVWVVDDDRTFTFDQDVDYDYLPTQNAIEFRTYTPRASADVHVTYDVAESSPAR